LGWRVFLVLGQRRVVHRIRAAESRLLPFFGGGLQPSFDVLEDGETVQERHVFLP
jgi:hypothetical protein